MRIPKTAFKSEPLWLAAILLMGAALRCIGLTSRDIWYDDAFSIFLSRQPLPAIIHGTAADTMPPFYYFLLHLWMTISTSPGFLRLLNVALSLGAVALLYALMRRLFTPGAGLWAAFLAAISPFQIYQSQELRSYALLALCQVGYTLFFVRLWQSEEKQKWWDWLGLVLLGTGAMYSHNLAVFVLAVPDLYLVARREWKLLARLLAAQLAIGLLALPWLIYLPGQISKVQRAWSIPLPGLVEVIQSVIISTSNLPLPSLWMAAALFASLLGAVFVAFELVHEREKTGEILMLAAFAILPPVLMLILSYLVKPIFTTRGFIFSALAYLGLAGYVISRRLWGIGAFVAAIFVAGSLIAIPYQSTYHEFPRSPFQQAAAYLKEVARPGDQVVHDNKLSGFPMRFYAPDLPQPFVADIPLSHNDTLAYGSEQAMGIFAEPDLPTAVGQARRVYFVVFKQTEKDYASLGVPVHPSLAWLSQHFTLSSRVDFSDLEIYQFDR